MNFIKILSIVLIFSTSINASAQSQNDVKCGQQDVFCMDELVHIADSSKSLEEVVENLPTHVKQNLTFKRGNNITKTINKMTGLIVGPHGHLAPNSDSQSASPTQPRAFVWDEKSGFTASWNSGNKAHKAHDRLDLYDFDFDTNEHRLLSWTAKDGFADHNFVDPTDTQKRSCVTCHGETQRPIFPMYPDWPQFYGEFNDEMAGYSSGQNALRTDLRALGNEFQPKERALYLDFISKEGQTNPRFSTLFDVQPSTGLNANNALYPFRPRNTTSPSTDVSRAFHHRPNLRLGVMYNRFAALRTFEDIKKSKVFQKFPDVIFFSLLDCDWAVDQSERTQILQTFLEGSKALDAQFSTIHLRGAKYTPAELTNTAGFTMATEGGQTVYYKSRHFSESGYRQIPYEDLLALLELNIADIDIRFRHDAKKISSANKFDVYDSKAFHFTNSAMDIGYVEEKYDLNPICDNSNTPCNFSYSGQYTQSKRYFNSYFDGSATTNELLAGQMLAYLINTNFSSSQPELRAVRAELRKKITNPNIYFETLMKKYSNFKDRLEYDAPFFNKMDAIGPWIQLPYPPHLLNVHNRESFWGSSAKTTAIRNRHAQWSTLANRQSDIRNASSICWPVYDSMKARYVK